MMHPFIFKLFVAFMLFCIASSKSVQEAHSAELNDQIRTIVETILKENQSKKSTEGNNIYLKKRIKYLETKAANMETKLVDQRRTIVDLQNVIQKLHESGKVNLEMETDNIIGNSTKVESSDSIRQMDRLFASERRSKRAAAVGNVAFSAYLSHTNFHTVIGNAVHFDKVLLNDGNNYNAYTGSFTAPVTGVYLFTFQIDTHKLTFVRLVVNGVNQVDAVANRHSNAESRHSQSMGGNTAIIHVKHGQAVLVETYEIPDAETASSGTFRLCTFSGVLLY